MDFDFPECGVKRAYLLYHEELESLVKHVKGLKRIRFWMTFGESYLTHLHVLQNVGMTRIDPVMYEGREIVPIKFLKALLPDPASLAPGYTGKTCIGCLIEGVKNGKPKKIFIYNVCDHAECYKEVKAQAISYTTGVPAMIGGMMMLTGAWRGEGVFNVEQFDPRPFMDKLKNTDCRGGTGNVKPDHQCCRRSRWQANQMKRSDIEYWALKDRACPVGTKEDSFSSLRSDGSNPKRFARQLSVITQTRPEPNRSLWVLVLQRQANLGVKGYSLPARTARTFRWSCRSNDTHWRSIEQVVATSSIPIIRLSLKHDEESRKSGRKYRGGTHWHTVGPMMHAY